MADHSANPGIDTRLQRRESILSGKRFEGLKAILDCLSPNRESLCQRIIQANSYEDLLASLGYRLTLTKQIHVQDCYSRMDAAGGIRAVLPYYDIPTQGSLPTLVNFDSTVTATPKSASFFHEMLLELKRQMSGPE